MTKSIDIQSMTADEIHAALAAHDLPKWRAAQIYKWFRRGAVSFEEMTDLPAALRSELSQLYTIYGFSEVTRQISRDQTAKHLWRIEGDTLIESVLMRYRHGTTVCISSQAGCKMGCAFCASTGLGFVRNLTAAEMEAQVRLAGSAAGTRPTGVVLMGIGEPLDNFDNVVRFIKLASDPDGLSIGMRHISLSTCGGIRGGIEKLAEQRLGITLSISLHAPCDEIRGQIMPCNRICGVSELLGQCARYFEATGRRISYEYALIDGLNDSVEIAEMLAKVLRSAPGHVNLIPLNKTSASALQPSPTDVVNGFQRRLQQLGVNCTIRRKLGGDVDAACGQLRLGSTISGGYK